MLVYVDPGSDIWVTPLKAGKVEPPGDNWTLIAIVDGKMIWKRSKIYAELEADAEGKKKGKEK